MAAEWTDPFKEPRIPSLTLWPLFKQWKPSWGESRVRWLYCVCVCLPFVTAVRREAVFRCQCLCVHSVAIHCFSLSCLVAIVSSGGSLQVLDKLVTKWCLTTLWLSLHKNLAFLKRKTRLTIRGVTINGSFWFKKYYITFYRTPLKLMASTGNHVMIVFSN